MTNLDKVRDGLRVLDEFSESSFTDDVIGDTQSALSAHEEEVRELVKLSTHALSVLRVNKYDIAADHLQEVLNKFEVKK